jgi:glycosyltransferase involved in cell wall biosynthesis
VVSIIIPTYNDENYISKCLDSVISQTYNDIEIIVIVDGATDRTESIVRQYAKKDKRINFFIQENAGAGPARNYGIKKANGEYIVFVDADDWLNADSIEILMNEITKIDSDFVIAGTASVEYFKGKYNISENVPKYLHVEGLNSTRNECFNLFVNGMGHAPTGKLYKSSIIHKNNIFFPNIRRSQDIVFNNMYYGCIKSLTVIDACIYNFRNPAYPDPFQKIKSSRRYDKKYIEAQDNYFKTIVMLDDDIKNRLKKWNIKITEPMEKDLANKLIVEINNFLGPILQRNYKSANNMLGLVLKEPKIKKALNKSKFNSIYYRLFAAFCKLYLKNLALLLVLIKIKARDYCPDLIIAMRKKQK